MRILIVDDDEVVRGTMVDESETHVDSSGVQTFLDAEDEFHSVHESLSEVEAGAV
ncbi:MAG: hypothetical protein AABZ47_13990 [Planctomycetota bacterium]